MKNIKDCQRYINLINDSNNKVNIEYMRINNFIVLDLINDINRLVNQKICKFDIVNNYVEIKWSI